MGSQKASCYQTGGVPWKGSDYSVFSTWYEMPEYYYSERTMWSLNEYMQRSSRVLELCSSATFFLKDFWNNEKDIEK